MSGAIVIESPLNLESVSPDTFIADLEPRSRDAHARPTELVQLRLNAWADVPITAGRASR
jgi:hypothetical protein